MSKFDSPTPAAIRRGVLSNKAAQAYIKKPVPGLEDICTEKGIVEGRPVIVVYRYGYVSTSAFDYEDGNTVPHGIGELVEVRPLEPDDEFHPNKVLVVYRATLPRTNRAGDPAKPPRKGKAGKGKRPAKAVTVVEGEDADDVSPPGYRFWLVYLNVPTGANLKLWPLDIIPPVRKALRERRDIDMREFRAEGIKAKKQLARMKRVGSVVAEDEDPEDLARELGIL